MRALTAMLRMVGGWIDVLARAGWRGPAMAYRRARRGRQRRRVAVFHGRTHAVEGRGEASPPRTRRCARLTRPRHGATMQVPLMQSREAVKEHRNDQTIASPGVACAHASPLFGAWALFLPHARAGGEGCAAPPRGRVGARRALPRNARCGRGREGRALPRTSFPHSHRAAWPQAQRRFSATATGSANSRRPTPPGRRRSVVSLPRGDQ